MDSNLKQQLIKKFHLEDMPEADASEILNDAGAVVMTGVITRGIPLLDEQATVECDVLLASDSDTTAEIFELLKKKVPTFQEIVDDEISLLEKTLA